MSHLPSFRRLAGLTLAIALSAVAVTIVPAQPAAAASRADTDQATLKDLYDRTKAAGETELNIYTAYPNFQPLWDAFMKDYPTLKISTTIVFGAPMFSRIAAEVASGNHAGDVSMSAFTDQEGLAKDGRVEAYVPPTSKGLAPEFAGAGGFYQIPFRNLFTLVYNANLVHDNEVPRSIGDILAPKWKGKVTFTKPGGTNIVDVCLTTLDYNHTLSDAQLQTLHANTEAAPNNTTVLANVAQGRFAIGLFAPSHSVPPLQKDGAPIKIAFLADSSVMVGPGISLLKTAPHSHAAKLLIAWLFSTRGQQMLAQLESSYGTMPGAPAPPNFPAITTYHLKDIPRTQADALIADDDHKTQALWGP
jgi:iron(III) transport system substrate-binding protein